MKNVVDEAFLRSPYAREIGFCAMATFKSPRVMMPVPRIFDHQEPDRNYDFTEGTVEAIIDTCATTYWDKDNYFRIKDRPYLSMCFTDTRSGGPGSLSTQEMIEHTKIYSTRKYGIDPYLVGVCMKPSDINSIFGSGVDALSGYAFLPDFALNEPGDIAPHEATRADVLQDYEFLLDKRIQEWHDIANSTDKPYVPPAVVGWDSSPRGTAGLSEVPTLDEVIGIYPFTPILTNSTPSTFGRMLNEQGNFIRHHVPSDEQYTPIMSWNEATEGAALLPRVTSDGTIDTSYLDTVHTFVKRKKA